MHGSIKNPSPTALTLRNGADGLWRDACDPQNLESSGRSGCAAGRAALELEMATTYGMYFSQSLAENSHKYFCCCWSYAFLSALRIVGPLKKLSVSEAFGQHPVSA